VSSDIDILSSIPYQSTKKVDEINNIEKDEEILLKEKYSSDFHVKESSLNISNNQDIFTYDLPDLEKVPGEIVLNSLLKGSMDTVKILDSYISKNHVNVVPYTAEFRSIENFYILNNKAYFLNLEQWAIVYHIITDCKNLSVVRKTMKKNLYID